MKKTTKTFEDYKIGETVAESKNGNITLVKYSDKMLALFGDTKPYKDEIKRTFKDPKFNRYLSAEGKGSDSEQVAGWIIKKDDIQVAINYLNTVK